jgi:uncharacterized protein
MSQNGNRQGRWEMLYNCRMKTKPLTFLLALTFLFLFSGSSVVFADDFQESYRLTLPLAEQGDVLAQYSLGVMYEKGQGVPQVYKEALKWYRLSAEQGYSSAQYNLGNRYYKGKGVPQDYVLAHMWYNLCGSSGDVEQYQYEELGAPKDCAKNRKQVEKKMSPQQIEKAQEMAINWKPKK